MRPARAYGLKKFGHEALGQQRMQGFAAYQLRTAFLRTNQKTLVSVLTSLVTSIGNQSSKCLIPWKHLGNLRLETEVF